MEITQYSDYWTKVRELAKIEFEETIDYVRSNDMEITDEQAAHDAALYAVEGEPHFLVYHKRDIIYYSDSDFGDPGWSQFENWQPETGSGLLKKLAQIALYNDIWKAYDYMLNARENLGYVYDILEYTWTEGEKFPYEHEKGIIDPITHEFTLESVGDGQWRVYDPNGDQFEVISPDVHFKQGDYIFPEIALNQFLNSVCNRRLHDLAYQSD